MAALLQCDLISFEVLKGFWGFLSEDGNALSTVSFIGLSKERPILDDNRKAHSEKRCAFHEKQH